MPFTLNFTITNLHYEEDMGRLGSWKFNTTERVLQGLVRALPPSLLPQLLRLAHLIPTRPTELTLSCLTLAPTTNARPTYLSVTPVEVDSTHLIFVSIDTSPAH